MIKRASVLLMLIFSVMTAWAAQDPVQMLENTTSQMLKALDQNREAIKNNPERLEALVRSIVLPHVDLTVVARSIAGRQHWLNASAQTREAFKHELVGYVVRTYASALSAYRNQQVKIYPYRGSLAGQDRLVIRSKVIPDKGNPISVDYRVLRQNGGWKVYDISVDGVSMVRSYRAQFAEILDQKGLSGLVQVLRQRQK